MSQKVKNSGSLLWAVALMMIMANVAAATELIWQPVNPSFLGGNPLNGSYHPWQGASPR